MLLISSNQSERRNGHENLTRPSARFSQADGPSILLSVVPLKSHHGTIFQIPEDRLTLPAPLSDPAPYNPLLPHIRSL